MNKDSLQVLDSTNPKKLTDTLYSYDNQSLSTIGSMLDEEKIQGAFTNEVIAVRPKPFYKNSETEQDNIFMHDIQLSVAEINEKALEEFQNFVNILLKNNIKVNEFEQHSTNAPDSIFPDWFTTHRSAHIPDGLLILYPMKYQSRRNERNEMILEFLKKRYKYFIDLTHWEKHDEALEGKGSLVFDIRNQKIYCSISQRASKKVLDDLLSQWNKISNRKYTAVTFKSQDENGNAIYHTDCVLTFLFNHAVISLESIKDLTERKYVEDQLSSPFLNESPYELIELSHYEVKGMCANMFNLINDDKKNCIIMSEGAYQTYDKKHLQILKKSYILMVTNIDCIELVGGGSTRCMLAEIY